jgi:hypothetical protein
MWLTALIGDTAESFSNLPRMAKAAVVLAVAIAPVVIVSFIQVPMGPDFQRAGQMACHVGPLSVLLLG